jgi:hypothetical protein
MVVTSRCYSMAFSRKNGSMKYFALKQSLAFLSSKSVLSNPLHLTIHVSGEGEACPGQTNLLLDGPPPMPIIYEILDITHQNSYDLCDTFRLARVFGAILHFATTCQSTETTDHRDDFAKDIAYEVENLSNYTSDDDHRLPNQLILCNITRLVLKPDELIAAAGEANDFARLKIFKLLKHYGTATRWSDAQKWDHYISRVKFVDSGFRPSEANMWL